MCVKTVFFRGILLISFDLMHKIKNLKELKIDGAQIPVKTAHFTYSKQKVLIDPDVDKKPQIWFVKRFESMIFSLLIYSYGNLLQLAKFEIRSYKKFFTFYIFAESTFKQIPQL